MKGVGEVSGEPGSKRIRPMTPPKSMISYGHIDEKGADEPDPAYMHHCKEYRLRNDKSAGDGLNGSIRLGESDLKAVGAETGDRVKVYVEANERWILYERETYTDRAGVGIPSSHREKLNLDPESRTIEIWLDEADEPESNMDSISDQSGSEVKQVSLTGEEPEPDGHKYVLIPDDDPFQFHHLSSSDDHETECGLNFKGLEHRRFDEAPDPLDQCSDCAIRSSEDMTNTEIVEWLGEQAGFKANEGTPAYLSKEQLVALRDYVIKLQENQTSEPAEQEEVTV